MRRYLRSTLARMGRDGRPRAAATAAAVAAAARAGGSRASGRRAARAPAAATSAPPSSAPGRGAAQRLPADAGDRAPLGRRLAPEPRLGLPGPPAARGRGPGRPDRGGPQGLHAHRHGPAHVEERRDELGAPWDDVKGDAGEGVGDLMEVMRPLGMALFQLTHSGTDLQRREALEVLNETRRKLYRILADEDPARMRPQGAQAPPRLPDRRRPALPPSGAAISYGGGTVSSSEAGPPLGLDHDRHDHDRAAHERRGLRPLVVGEPDPERPEHDLEQRDQRRPARRGSAARPSSAAPARARSGPPPIAASSGMSLRGTSPSAANGQKHRDQDELREERRRRHRDVLAVARDHERDRERRAPSPGRARRP